MTGYCLFCTLCKGEYFTKSEWLKHLTTEGHQTLARKECLEEWRGVPLDECLVLFCSSGLSTSGADKVVEWFSKRPGTFVTDFVWWEDRPRVGVMRFDSRKKVDEVLSRIDGLSVITISNEEKVKVRRATDLDDLEWNGILPVERVRKSPQPLPSPETTDHTLEARALEIKVEQDATSTTSEEAPAIKLEDGSSVTITEETPNEPDSTTTEISHKNDNENTKKRKPVPVADSLNSSNKIEAPEPGPSPKKSKVDDQAPPTVSKPVVSPANSISVLMELCQRQKWPRPVFRFSSIEISKAPTTFLCSVFVKGTEYKPDETIVPALTKQEAKRDIANLCYKILAPTFPSKLTTHTSLHMEFTCIQNLVTIPEEEYNKVLKTACDLKVVFSQSDSSTDVALFRNGHLKLRLSEFGSTEPLIYVCHLKAPRNHPQSFSWIPETTVKQVLGGKQGIKRFAILEALEDSSRFDPNVKQFGWKIQHLSTGITFQLVLFKRFMAEVQVCRMAKYLCSFDSRCLPLITLVYYWATVNNLNLSIGGGDPNHKKHCHRVLPGQLTLEWLVIHFLCHKKVIPTPRQVQQRPHPILKERLSDIDVGFRATDTSFQQTWKSGAPETEVPSDTSSDEFYLTVLQLFQEFLQFYGETLNVGGNWGWILNTRDGETINTNQFLNDTPGSSWDTQMTASEFADLKGLQFAKQIPRWNNNKARGAPASFFKPMTINFTEWKLYMVHPFIPTWRFCISRDMQPVLNTMKQSGIKLKEFLNMRKNNGTLTTWKKFGVLKNVLNVSS